MNSFLAVMCLISSLVTPGYALQCTDCVNSDSSPCSGNTITCAANLVCVSVYRSSSEGMNEIYYVARGCGDKSICGKSGVLGFPDAKKHRFSATCCESDKCTPPTPVLPLLNLAENGKTCPYCQSIGPECRDSIVTKNVTCTGDENTCVLYIEEEKGGPSGEAYLRGCATKGFCDQGSWKMEYYGIQGQYSVECGASTELYSALILLILATTSLMSNVF